MVGVGPGVEWASIIGVEDAPGFEVGDSAFDRGADAVDLCVELVIGVGERAVFAAFAWGEKFGSDIAFIGDGIDGSVADVFSCGGVEDFLVMDTSRMRR